MISQNLSLYKWKCNKQKEDHCYEYYICNSI